MRQFFRSLRYMLRFTFDTWKMFFAHTKKSKVPFWQDFGCVNAQFYTKTSLLARRLEAKRAREQQLANVIRLSANKPKTRVLN